MENYSLDEVVNKWDDLFSKLIYGVSVVILISFFYLFTNIHYIHIFVSFLISMLISLTYLRVKERNVWKNE